MKWLFFIGWSPRKYKPVELTNDSEGNRLWKEFVSAEFHVQPFILVIVLHFFLSNIVGFDLVFAQRQKARDINFLPIIVAIALSPVDDERNSCWWVVSTGGRDWILCDPVPAATTADAPDNASHYPRRLTVPSSSSQWPRPPPRRDKKWQHYKKKTAGWMKNIEQRKRKAHRNTNARTADSPNLLLFLVC
jgi:hypothetical protein